MNARLKPLRRLNACRTAALAFSFLLSVGCGTAQPERSSGKAAQTPRDSGSAESLLVNALLRQFADNNSQQALTFVSQAAGKAPDRVDIAWLHAQLCLQTRGCEPEPLLARLGKLDPANGTAWLGALARAQQQQDRAAEDQILEVLSRSKHFNIYWNTLVSRVAVAFSKEVAAGKADKLPDPLSRAVNQTVNWISGIALPTFEPLAESCTVTRMVRAEISQRCARIAAALQHSDSYVAEGMGLGIAQRIATPGTPPAAKVAERIGTARYQRDTAGQIIESQVDRDKFTKELLQLMASLPREQDVFIAVMRWAGQPLEPSGNLPEP
jgi:hypothetical protein